MRAVVILSFIACLFWEGSIAQQITLKDPVRYLALGDSYTIGESVTINERWPVQLKDSFEQRGYEVEALVILATTGWTTGNLLQSIDKNKNKLDGPFNLVSLLIGVNNQYQGRGITEYQEEFRQLLQIALDFAGNNSNQVFVLSIPDYYYTPFGQSFGSPQISNDIELFNERNREITSAYKVPYINITDISQNGISNPSLIANDGLHPSGLQYSEWVERILQHIQVNTPTILARMQNENISVFYNIYTKQVVTILPHEDDTPFTLNLFSLQGMNVLSEQIYTAENSLQVPSGLDGLFIYTLTSNRKTIQSGKIYIP